MRPVRLHSGQSGIAVAKNAVRGAVGSKSIEIGDVISSSVDLLSPREIPKFVDWVERYPSKRVRIWPWPKVTNYAKLWPVAPVQTSLSKNVWWISSFLANHLSLLRKYIAILEDYELAWLSGRYVQAGEHLDEIESASGLSIWLIESRIALLQRHKGLEAQKAYWLTIHEAAPRSLAAFVASYISQRNEETVFLDRFNTRVRSVVERQHEEVVNDDLKAYLIDWLVGRTNSPPDESKSSSILSAAAASVNNRRLRSIGRNTPVAIF